MRQPRQPLGIPHAGLDRESGLATVEFALVSLLLLGLLFGIITYGMILAVKGTVTQAAAEGARAAVTAAAGTAATTADAQSGKSVGWLGGPCNSGQISCAETVKPCDPAVPAVNCITVTVSYLWTGSPLAAITFLPHPDKIESTSVVQINNS